MRKFTLTCSFVFMIAVSFSQNSESNNHLLNIFKADISVIGTGVSYDVRLGNKISVVFATGLGGGYDISENGIDYT